MQPILLLLAMIIVIHDLIPIILKICLIYGTKTHWNNFYLNSF